ncbi:uncharacterized protein LOC144757755 [Lissotriton helveticus]
MSKNKYDLSSKRHSIPRKSESSRHSVSKTTRSDDRKQKQLSEPGPSVPIQEQQTDPKQKILFIDPQTGKVVTKKRKSEQSEDKPLPSKKRTMGTNITPPASPRPRVTPSSPIPHNRPHIPTPSTPRPATPQSDVDSDIGEGEPQGDDKTIPDEEDPWENYDVGSDEDNDPELYPSKPSPPDDNTGFVQLINRAAKYHKLDMHTEPQIEDFLLETLPGAQRTSGTLPMLKGLLTHTEEIFENPVRARVLNPRIDKKYKAAPKDPIFIRGHVPLDSLVVSNARKRANSLSTGEAPPPDKESKLIDASGKRVASQAANSWRIANTQALLARYDRAHYDELEKLLTHLPKEHQKKADQLIQEGKIITNTSIKCALDAADTAARSINTSVMLRRHAWLRISGFKQEVQTALLNKPFDQKTLFGSSTDETLEKMKKDTETAKSMGALQQPTHRGSFRRSTYRGGSKNTGTNQQSTSFTPTSPRGNSRGSYRGNNNKGRGRGNNNNRNASTPKQ